MYLIFLFLSSNIFNTYYCFTYYFRQTNNIENIKNWRDTIPCENDRIFFNERRTVVTILSNSLAVSSIDFPKNGIFFLANNAIIGSKGTWQCSQKVERQGNFFKSNQIFKANI